MGQGSSWKGAHGNHFIVPVCTFTAHVLGETLKIYVHVRCHDFVHESICVYVPKNFDKLGS